MLKLIALAAALGFSLTAAANAAVIVYRGEAIIVAKSATCQGPPINGAGPAIYYFPLAGTTNTNVSSFRVNWGGAENVITFQMGGGPFTTAFQAVNVFDTFEFTSPGSVQLKIVSQVPATVTNTTKFVNLRLQIKGHFGSPSCIVTFDVALLRTPDL